MLSDLQHQLKHICLSYAMSEEELYEYVNNYEVFNNSITKIRQLFLTIECLKLNQEISYMSDK